MGEKTLDCLLAFTALRLEMVWRRVPIDATQLETLKFMKPRQNSIEEVMETLVH